MFWLGTGYAIALGAFRMPPTNIHQQEPARQRARELANTPEFGNAQRQRKKVEALFAELKNQIGLRRLRLRRLKFVREQFFLAAAAQNKITTIDVPDEEYTDWAGDGVDATNVLGVSTGIVWGATDGPHGYVLPPFGKPIYFDAPGCVSTITLSINFASAVTGYCVDSSSVYHGFLWTPF